LVTLFSTRFFGDAVALAVALATCLASATISRAQGAAGAGTGSTETASTSQPPRNIQPGQTKLPDQSGQSGQSGQSTPPAQVPGPGNQLQAAIYEPITGTQRIGWVLRYTVEPPRLIGDMIYAGIETADNDPHEYGPHWDGFGKRVGILVAGAAVSNTMEATLGSFWGEDPRYFRVPDESFGARVKQVVKLTFVARGRDGNYHPAYARYMAIPSANWLSNSWRANSQATNGDAAIRTAEGFGARMGSNAYNEFWPSVRDYLFHHNH
jgi:hypothetical protein